MATFRLENFYKLIVIFCCELAFSLMLFLVNFFLANFSTFYIKKISNQIKFLILKLYIYNIYNNT